MIELFNKSLGNTRIIVIATNRIDLAEGYCDTGKTLYDEARDANLKIWVGVFTEPN